MKNFVLLVFIFLLITTETYTKNPLRFNSNGKFKIAQFTDMHFGEDMVSDNKTMKQQRDIIEWEKPDLVVVTGDSVTGCAYPKDNTCLYVYYSLFQSFVQENSLIHFPIM